MAKFRGSKRGVWLCPNNERNSIRIKDSRYYLDFLNYNKRNAGKGFHSSVFALIDEDDVSKRTLEGSKVIKLCNYPVKKVGKEINAVNERDATLVSRFLNEIRALRRIKESEHREKVVELDSFGILEFDDHYEEDTKHQLLWFTAERADFDLSEFLNNNSPSVDQKISICFDLLTSLIALHNIGIIHRDIKPDNVVFINGAWKFLDLGISDSNDRNLGIDSSGEKIGPFGYMSPEALNKHMGIKSDPMFSASCDIDEHSDVFQLGMLFWYIIRGEVPAGIMQSSDLDGTRIDHDFFHNGLSHMLQLRKERRLRCDEVLLSLSPLFKTYGL